MKQFFKKVFQLFKRKQKVYVVEELYTNPYTMYVANNGILMMQNRFKTGVVIGVGEHGLDYKKAAQVADDSIVLDVVIIPINHSE